MGTPPLSPPSPTVNIFKAAYPIPQLQVGITRGEATVLKKIGMYPLARFKWGTLTKHFYTVVVFLFFFLDVTLYIYNYTYAPYTHMTIA